MSKETREYTNNNITVVWKPNACIHSALCWKGLLEVFNPRERPWININGATSERIIEQVRKCPSGALSYFYNNPAIDNHSQDNVVAEAAKILKIEVTPKGPYIIQSECLIVHADGREEVKPGVVLLCRCGASKTKPYCDGSHDHADFMD